MTLSSGYVAGTGTLTTQGQAWSPARLTSQAERPENQGTLTVGGAGAINLVTPATNTPDQCGRGDAQPEQLYR